ncbi:MAG TPA: hypothetical protein VMR54_00570 [Thermoanaerobaculia bacterium]|nr:hypothetical protein [Thermoanaerobaculia bacterium]
MILGVLAPPRPAPDPERRALWSPRLDALRQDADEWCAGRSWHWRSALLAYLLWAGVRHLRDPLYSSLFGGITFGIHELGHLLFAFGGKFIGVAGGSVAQVAAPAIAAALLFRQRDYFGVAVGGAWEAFSLWNLATYIGDARSRELPLIGLTSDPIHDWNWLLGHLGILAWDHTLAGLTRLAAFSIWSGSVALGGWLCWRMASKRKG